jgi:putative transposase
MPAPLSNDMRKRIIAAKERGESHAKVARELQVSESAITRLLALYRESGSVAPRALNNGRKPRLDEVMLPKIRQRIEEQPDIALHELIEVFSLPVSVPALCKTLNGKLKLRRKKNGTRGRAASEGCGVQTTDMESDTAGA